MLVLARKEGERVMIGRDIVITVVAIRGTSVRLGIDAPADVGIWREEILPGRCATAIGPETSRDRAVGHRLAVAPSHG